MALTIERSSQRAVIKNIIKRQFLYNSNRNCLYSILEIYVLNSFYCECINGTKLVSSNAATIAINITIIIILNTLLFTI